MVIEINGQQNTQSASVRDTATSQVTPGDENVTQRETGGTSTPDTVSITDAATQLANIENTLSSIPVVDTQRVESLQRAIDEGSFNIDPQRIADKLLRFEGTF